MMKSQAAANKGNMNKNIEDDEPEEDALDVLCSQGLLPNSDVKDVTLAGWVVVDPLPVSESVPSTTPSPSVAPIEPVSPPQPQIHPKTQPQAPQSHTVSSSPSQELCPICKKAVSSAEFYSHSVKCQGQSPATPIITTVTPVTTPSITITPVTPTITPATTVLSSASPSITISASSISKPATVSAAPITTSICPICSKTINSSQLDNHIIECFERESQQHQLRDSQQRQSQQGSSSVQPPNRQ